MENLLLSSTVLLFCFLSWSDVAISERSPGFKTYIVAVRRPAEIVSAADGNGGGLRDYYNSFLPPKTNAAGEGSRLVYAYEEVFSGFAARLTPEELAHVAAKEGFLGAYPDRKVSLLTTRTHDFLGLRLGRGLWRDRSGELGRGVVIGVIDSGITPDHPSFDDRGMSPPPAKWKGGHGCTKDLCNRKLIGAAVFGDPTALDDVGHGTHTSSTAAGTFVSEANLAGQANGTAVGIAPRAHIASYKVCNFKGCSSSDITAAIDLAVKDGVDVISMSLGGESTPYYGDPIAIGTLAAVEKGIITSLAGGNSGPFSSTVSNEAPWMITVAATSFDRSFRAILSLANGRKILGESIVQPKLFQSDPLPIISKEDCEYSNLTDIEGKIVICQQNGMGIIENVGKFGAVAAVVVGDESTGATVRGALDTALPTVRVSYEAGLTILDYIKSATPAKAAASLAFHGTVVGVSPAPVVADFSSRGPSSQNRHVLKPDISGPGLNVLAAWPTDPLYETANGGDRTSHHFAIISGTSMATPHISGVAALLKAAHPEWSPAAVKSAIMTTSDVKDNEGKPIRTEKLLPAGFYDMGAGHVNPNRAADPGLIYDESPEVYTPFLCGLGYSEKEVSVIARRNVSCEAIGKISPWDLNYPSISLGLSSGDSVSVKRTVTNVGPEGSISYRAVVDKLAGVEIAVKPETLVFGEVGESLSFTVTFRRKVEENIGSGYVEGNLRWISGKYVVRSPLHVDLEKGRSVHSGRRGFRVSGFGFGFGRP